MGASLFGGIRGCKTPSMWIRSCPINGEGSCPKDKIVGRLDGAESSGLLTERFATLACQSSTVLVNTDGRVGRVSPVRACDVIACQLIISSGHERTPRYLSDFASGMARCERDRDLHIGCGNLLAQLLHGCP